MSSGNDEVQRELTDLARPARLMRDAETTVGPAVDVPQPIVLIEPRALHRDCLTRCLGGCSGQRVLAFPTIEDWHKVKNTVSTDIIIFSATATSREADLQTQLSRLVQAANGIHVVVLSDLEDPDQIIRAFQAGVRGYVPTSLPLDVAIESVKLVRAGGTFAPANSLLAARHTKSGRGESGVCGSELFTERQAAVVRALRLGKPNKIIAYELNMSESTVKVHVRNIMKKLRAKNRTEVAFMTNALFNGDTL
jgi:DNA-binding NarL/FixJ family response regulator